MSRRLFGLIAVCVLVLLLNGSALAQIVEIQPSNGSFGQPYSPLPVDNDNDDEDEYGVGLGFGKKIAGTWLGMGAFDLDLNCDGVADILLGISVTDLHTFDVGGSHLVTNPDNPNTIHATWIRTGPRQLTSEGIGFGSDPNCTVATDGTCTAFGPVVSVFNIKTVLDFDSDFQNASTSFAATVHPPTEDPLDPDAVVNLCTLGSHESFQKVNVPE